MRAIGPATNICHQNAAQKFTGHTEAKRSGNSTSGVPAKISQITLIASDIPVTTQTVCTRARAFGLSFSWTKRFIALCTKFDTTNPSTSMTINRKDDRMQQQYPPERLHRHASVQKCIE